MDSAIGVIFQLAILIFSVVIHEVSHGLAANALGDPTAKYAGRLTLNPLKHLDPFGSVILPFLLAFAHLPIIGWARPVPYNPYNLKVRNQDLGSAVVGAAGPGANIAVALVFGFFIRFSPLWAGSFGSIAEPLVGIMSLIVLINLILATFNLVPIPPLDGSKVLFTLLPYRWHDARQFLERFGFFLLLIFIFYFSQWILPVVSLFFRLFTGSAAPF